MATTSIVDYLTSKGQDSSVSSRAQLAVDHGLVGSTQEYLSLASRGENASINTALLGKLSSGAAAPTKTATGTALAGGAPVVTGGPMKSSDLTKSYNLPEPTKFVDGTNLSTMNEVVGNVARQNLKDPNQLAIDQLKAQLQESATRKKEAAQAQVDQYGKKLNKIVDSTATQDAFNEGIEEYKVKENLRLYSEIQQRIVDTQSALETGLIYEKDRPARMKFITGAESTLKQQGLATIGALQGTASVIKGNIEIAKSIIDSTISAINTDNERSFKALTTLLDLANNDLVSLTKEEKEIIDSRISSIETAATDLQAKRDSAIELMTKFPRAYHNGGVTLLDSYETALQKMLPVMAADETAKFEADLAAKNRVGTEGGADKLSAAELSALKAEMLDLKTRGMTYEEAIVAYSNDVPIDYINAVYQRKPTPGDPQDQITNAYYNQYLNPDGSVKAGYNVTVDPENGRPVVTKSNDGPGFWGSIGNAFSSLFN